MFELAMQFFVLFCGFFSLFYFGAGNAQSERYVKRLLIAD